MKSHKSKPGTPAKLGPMKQQLADRINYNLTVGAAKRYLKDSSTSTPHLSAEVLANHVRSYVFQLLGILPARL